LIVVTQKLEHDKIAKYKALKCKQLFINLFQEETRIINNLLKELLPITVR